MAADPQRARMTVAEFFKLVEESNDVRYEYYHGYAVAMAGGTVEHSRVKVNLAMLFNQRLLSGPCYVFDSDMYTELAEDIYVLPDLVVSCDVTDNQRGNTYISSPRMAIEALSPSTQRWDRTEKAAAYRRCEWVQEYAFVHTNYQKVEVFRRIAAQHEDEEDQWTSHVYFPGEDAEFASLHLTIPVSD